MSVLQHTITETNFLVDESLIPMLQEVNFPIFLYSDQKDLGIVSSQSPGRAGHALRTQAQKRVTNKWLCIWISNMEQQKSWNLVQSKLGRVQKKEKWACPTEEQ